MVHVAVVAFLLSILGLIVVRAQNYALRRAISSQEKAFDKPANVRSKHNNELMGSTTPGKPPKKPKSPPAGEELP